MADWFSSMQQTFEFYTVDPGTWKDVSRIDNVLTSTINRDLSSPTLGSATIDVENLIGECYIRAYLITIQNGIREKHPLGTYLVQTPTVTFDGRTSKISLDAYTPLVELKENKPPIGYALQKFDTSILGMTYNLTKEHMRAPVIEPNIGSAQAGGDGFDKRLQEDFVADPNETWLDFLQALMGKMDFTYQLDELGRVMFAPKQETAALQPKWSYNDDNSILYPSITASHDMYGIPNVVEVVYSTKDGAPYCARVVNDDPNSPISTINRGREIIHRDTSPSFAGDVTQGDVQIYATKLLSELSTVEYSLSYQHGYTPTTIGDCVLLNYKRAGLENVKAKIISQSIKCEPGCPVTETATFTNKLWR